MRVLIVAMNDRSVYLAVDTEDDFWVVSREELSGLCIGTWLEADFDEAERPTNLVTNLNKGTTLPVRIEYWGGDVTEAISILIRLRQPKRIFAIAETFSTDSKDIVERVRKVLY